MITARDPVAGDDRARAVELAVAAAVQAVGRGDLASASRLADRALSGGHVHPVLLRLRAAHHAQEGCFEAAAADFRAALVASPDDAGTLSALGLCLGRLGRLGEAAEVLERAIALQPSLSAARFRRGWVAELAGEYRAARLAYERAARDPSQIEAPGALALLAARRGDWAQARRWTRVAIEPAGRTPSMRLAAAALALAEDRPQEAEAGLRALLRDSLALDPVTVSTTRRQLGDVLDTLGRPADAFASWVQGAAELRQAVEPRFRGGNPERSSALAGRLEAAFAGARPEDWRRPAPSAAALGSAKGHVFLIGFPRSGTTLTNQVLATCPDAAVLDERELLVDAARQFLRDEQELGRLAAADEDQLDVFRRLYWRRVSDAGCSVEGRVFIDKLPLNLLGLPLICRLFPQAKVLYMVRDPRDVIISCLQQRFAVNSGTFELLDLHDAAGFYDLCARLSERYLRVLDIGVRRQSYEALVDTFDAETQAICAFAGLTWTPAVRDFHLRPAEADVATPSAAQLARGLNRASIGRWRRYAGALEPVAPILAPWVRQLGYEDT